MQEEATPKLERNARAVYEALTTIPVGKANGISRQDLADLSSVPFAGVPLGVHWAIRLFAPANFLIGSTRGRGGGYFVAGDKMERDEVLLGRLFEVWTHLARDVALVDLSLIGLRGKVRAGQIATRDGMQATKRSTEQAIFTLTNGQVVVGDLREAMQS